MRDDGRVYSLLGLAMKAGKVRSGSFQVEEAIQKGQACLVILAEDAMRNTADAILNKCDYYKVPCIRFGSKEMLGAAIGREHRACVALLDAGFSGSVKKWTDSGESSTAPQAGYKKERGCNGEDENQ